MAFVFSCRTCIIHWIGDFVSGDCRIEGFSRGRGRTQHRDVLSIPKFKRLFKKGSIIEGFTLNKHYEITAIGQEKFLAREIGYSAGEKMFMILDLRAYWRLPTTKE